MDPQPQTSLGADDYQALMGMFVSPDAGARAQGAALAKKMTPDEQQGFFDFQQQANRGRDATSQRVDSNIIGGTEGGGIAPEDVLMVGQAGAKIVGAAARSGVVGAVKETVAQASPIVKFEVARRTIKAPLVAAGLPNWLADDIATGGAALIAGYRKGATAKGPVDSAAPHLDRAVPVQPSALTQEQLAERVLYGRGTPPPPVEKPPLGRVRTVSDVIAPDVAPAGPAAAPPAVPGRPAASGAPSAAPPSTPESSSPAPRPANTLPDQKALNEQALAARRAAYQARQAEAAASDAAAKGQPPPAPARPKLTAAESKEFLRLRQTMTDPQAMEAIQAARDFLKRFGMSTPTVPDTKFPKQ